MDTCTLISPIEWDSLAFDHLDGVGGEPADTYFQEYREGTLYVFAIIENLWRVGTALLRMEEKPDGELEGVLVAAGARGRGDLTMQVLPKFELVAAQKGATSFRLHTERPGLVRKLAHWAKERELVITMRLDHGR